MAIKNPLFEVIELRNHIHLKTLPNPVLRSWGTLFAPKKDYGIDNPYLI